MRRASYGPSVKDGQVRYFSASSLTMADESADGGCLRRWWFEKIDGRRPEERPYQTAGIAIHAEIERYLSGDLTALGPMTIRGKPYMPTPGPDLFIEHDMVISPELELNARAAATEDLAADIRATATLETAPLRVRGIPVVGYIDLLHNRCTNKGALDIEDTVDPEGTVEVLDWKTTSRAEYVKSADAMSRTLQMTTYAKWVLATLPATAWVRLSHVYFITRGSTLPMKVSQRVSLDRIEQQWTHVARVASSVVDAARETAAEAVPANAPRACGAYGGCPHRSYCTANANASLVELFGTEGAQRMIRSVNTVTTTAAPRKSLFGLGKKSSEIDPQLLIEETRRIVREEVEAKHPGLVAAWDELMLCNVGHPEFTGELARIASELQGLAPVTHLEGTGELGTYGPFSEPSDLPGLLAEVKDFVLAAKPRPTPAPVALLPPDAPASDPELASVRPATPAAVEATPKKRPGRPRKELGPDPMTQLPLPTVPVPAPVGDTVNLTNPCVEVEVNTGLARQRIHFYVNCRPSCPSESFWPVVNDMIQEMNRVAGDALDFRLVPSDHPFAFGRWKAAIAAALRVAPLSAGHYVLDGAHGEIGITVAEAMRAVIAERDGVFVQ